MIQFQNTNLSKIHLYKSLISPLLQYLNKLPFLSTISMPPSTCHYHHLLWPLTQDSSGWVWPSKPTLQ